MVQWVNQFCTLVNGILNQNSDFTKTMDAQWGSSSPTFLVQQYLEWIAAFLEKTSLNKAHDAMVLHFPSSSTVLGKS